MKEEYKQQKTVIKPPSELEIKINKIICSKSEEFPRGTTLVLYEKDFWDVCFEISKLTKQHNAEVER